MEDALTDRHEGEFSRSRAVQKLHRFAFDTAGWTHFGLLDYEGEVHYFKANVAGMTNISAEMYDLGRAARYFAAGGVRETFLASSLPVAIPRDSEGLVEPFVGPLLKILRAREHFDRLSSLLHQHGERTNLQPIEISRDDRNVIWEMRWSAEPPAIVPLLIGDTVHNLRTALDVLINDVARARGYGSRQFKFPFAPDRIQLARPMADIRPLGPDVCAAIEALNPTKEGNSGLRGLHDLDIIDKHRLIIPVFFRSWKRHNLAQRLMDGIVKEHPTTPPFHIEVVSDLEETPLGPGDTFTTPIGDDPLRYYEDVPGSFEALFPAVAGLPFVNQSVLVTLSDLIQITHDICKSFRAQFGPPI